MKVESVEEHRLHYKSWQLQLLLRFYHVSDCMFIQRHYTPIHITPVFSKSVYLSLFSYFVFLVSLTDPALASSLCLFSSISPQFLNFLTFKVLFCYSRTESRISIWRYDSFAIRHLCFFQLCFPADRTYFHTSRSVRPLALVVSSVCVNSAQPPPCLDQSK